MSTRLLVTECFDGKHAECKGYNGPAAEPNFRCNCDCHAARSTTPSPTASERAERLIAEFEGRHTVGYLELADRIISEITAAERAAEARGAERMRQRAATWLNGEGERWRHAASRWQQRVANVDNNEPKEFQEAALADRDAAFAKYSALFVAATALAALPLEEGR